MNDRRRADSRRNAGTLLALFGLLAIAIGLIALCAMVLPQIFGFVAVVLGLFCFGVLHYLLWGWWMTGARSREDIEDNSPS